MTSDTKRPRRIWPKLVVFAAVTGASVWAGLRYRDQLTLSTIAATAESLHELRQSDPLLVYAAAFGIYVVVTGLSLPGAAAFTLVYGWFFGFWRTLVLVSFASTAGATIAFLLTRYIFRDLVLWLFGARLRGFNAALERDGPFYLFTLRLIPAVPFVAINSVMGLTPIRAWTFWWVSQLGMLPGTAVYVYAGSAVPDAATLANEGIGGILTPEVVIAFVLLGLFPLVVKRIVRAVKAPPATGEAESEPESVRDDAKEALDE